MSAKHTPAPWVLAKGAQITSANGCLIASAWLTARMPDANEQREPGESWLDAYDRLQPERDLIEAEMEANARLIAAAPDLLAACAHCEGLLSFHEGSERPEHEGAHPTVRINGDDLAAALSVLRAAIAKATT